MKNMLSMVFFVVGIINCANTMTSTQNLLLSLTTTSTWREFRAILGEQISKKRVGKKDKWVLVGEIKLKSKDSLFLNNLKARWRGDNLGNTFASLYSKKLTDRRLPVPIEENLICDGTWNPSAKEFVFPVNKKLVASDTYYLMLNVPVKYETQLRRGSFEIIQDKKRALLRLKK